MSDLNKAMLIGRLGKDAVLKYTPNGTPILEFSIATSEKWKDKEGKQQQKTEWSGCQMWGKRGESIAQYLKKGMQVYVEGKLSTTTWEKDGVKHYRTQIVLSDIQWFGERQQPDPSEPSDPDM